MMWNIGGITSYTTATAVWDASSSTYTNVHICAVGLKVPQQRPPFFFCIFTYKKCEAEKRDNITASNRGFTRLHNSVSLNVNIFWVHPAQHTISLIAIHWLLLRYMINTRLYSISPQTLSAFPDCDIILETLCLFAGFDMIFNLWLTTSH